MDWRKRRGRRRTLNTPGDAHLLTFSCHRRIPFFQAERCCEWLAEQLDSARQTLAFDLWAYVFMPDHVHLVIHPTQAIYDIRVILKAIKSEVGRKAIAYLRAHAPHWLPRVEVRGKGGSEYRFWQAGGGHDRNIWSSQVLFAIIEYVHQNPVRRGLVATAADWKWSSAGWLLGLRPNRLQPDRIDPHLLDMQATGV